MAEVEAQTTPDTPPSSMSDAAIVQFICECMAQADEAKSDRMEKNRANRQAYMGLQDWSYKNEGQSTEFIPKVAQATEQFAGVIKKALVQFGSWFEVELGFRAGQVLTPEAVRNLMTLFLDNLPDGEIETKSFSTVLTDAVKSGLHEALIILKIHGRYVERPTYNLPQAASAQQPELDADGEPIDTGELSREDTSDLETLPEEVAQVGPEGSGFDISYETAWRLVIDHIPAEHYYPDPTGRNLYVIHEVERDLHEVLTDAEQGVYDDDALQTLRDLANAGDRKDTKRSEAERGQNQSTTPRNRKTVWLQEFWGTILNEDGEVEHRNCLATLINKTHVLRRPRPNPFWHQRPAPRAAPIIRVPHSIWHKALYDDASPLNFALNELFNLVLDGGLASVWGVRQVRANWLEDPTEIGEGIPQGATLVVNDQCPPGGKVVEQVTEGEISQAAYALIELLDREFTASALTNQLKLGQLPGRTVRATEIVELQQSNSVTLDAISMEIENFLSRILEQIWWLILQFMEDFDFQEIIDAIGVNAAFRLQSMSKEERFALFATEASFKANGLSQLMKRARDFQKLMAFLQVATTNPVMLQEFMKNYSTTKVMNTVVKMLDLDPDDLQMTEDEKAGLDQRIRGVVELARAMGGQGPGGVGSQMSPSNTGGPETSGEIQQLQRNPLSSENREA